MPILSTLKTAKVSSKIANDPVLKRRSNLIQKLQEQVKGADALLAGMIFQPKKVISKRGADGSRERAEVEKRFRPWFWHDVGGTWYVEVHHGTTPLAVGKNAETAIVAGARENLPKVLKSLISAVEAGELDALMSGVPKRKKAA